MKTLTFMGLAALLMPVAALAHDLPPEVTDAYALSANPMSAAAFMAIHNPRHVDCTLAAVSTPAANRAELHTHKDDAGMMTMRKVDALTLPAEGDLILQRSGNHVMLMGLTQPLKDGDTVALTLDFGPCGTVEADVPVDSKHVPAAAPAMSMDHAGTGHDGMNHADTNAPAAK